jgi:replicative DNA helicase
MSELRMPTDLESEKAVLGCMLDDASAIVEAQEMLSADDFYRPANKAIFQAVGTIYAHGDIPDELLLAKHLQDAGKLDSCGGNEYLHSVASSVASSVNVEAYAKRVRDRSIARRAMVAAMELQRSVEADTPESIDRCMDILAGLRAGTSKDEAIRLFDAIMQAAEVKDREWFCSGIAGIDTTTGGIYPGGLTVLAGLPGSGKTTLAMQILTRAGASGHSVYIFTGDQPTRDVAINTLCAQVRETDDRVFASHKTADVMVQMERWNIYLDEGDMTLGRMLAVTKRKIASGFRFFCVDYLQLVNVSSKLKKYEAAEEVANEFKALAKRHNVYVVLISSQVKPDRSGSGTPEMGDIRGGNDIAHAADQIWFMHADPKNAHATDLHVKKNRRGKRNAVIPLQLIGAHHYLRDRSCLD